ncbi:FtsW/RodA/SpoVE family cell cycle protein [Arsenicibacter rosenii]|uniref:Penicillin-binding protein n=1 Tax=Arsenicibacter rosenii TaxID=1750698 RepID=A0A1S2VRN3_9BACT|nr:FtsW/RodA/SpoVE family cell cycle protein [Arsenicibacter rosenii]OIN60975.1 penicillin-binding protein [Arsenicibacter rosenii]
MNQPAQTRPAATVPYWLLAATIFLLFLFYRLYQHLSPALQAADQSLTSGAAILLCPGTSAEDIRQVLTNGSFYTDDRDIDLVADSLSARLTHGLSNLGALNKQEFAIRVPNAWQPSVGGTDFYNRVRTSRQRMGFDSLLYRRELTNPKAYPSEVAIGQGEESYAGNVTDARTQAPMSGVLVQLQKHTSRPDQPYQRFYARTDADGRFTFTGLAADSGYSAVPLKPGFEFGNRQGTASLNGSFSASFTARPHTIRLIGPLVYDQIKDYKAFIVRTPADFTRAYGGYAALFFLSFWLVYAFWSYRRFTTDPLLLPLLMLLTGVSLLTLFSIQDPVQDTMHANQNAIGIAFGLLGLTIVSQLPIGKLYSQWTFDALVNFRKRTVYNLTGWTWLIIAIVLAFMTLVFGSGPEGSGVRVNLNLGLFSFQPSELTKYLFLLFLAGFFAANAPRIRDLSDIRWRARISLGVFGGTLAILILYLLLGDMGPALVICLTFLVFYSIARGNLGYVLAAGAVYGATLWLLPALNATLLSFMLVILLLVMTKTVRSATGKGWLMLVTESPVLLLLIMAAFVFGNQLPGVGSRLADREAMWLNPWNNDVYGGDHLAHAYWSLSSGGFSGQGLGKGLAHTMPAAHTDMILASFGEDTGWLGLAAVFVAFGLLFHRTFLHARKAGQPFSFYLCAGIGIANGLQFLLIAGGSLGLLPLTGIAVPFLSYGKISLILNLTAFGVVAGMAHRPGQATQQEYVQSFYDPVLLTGILGFMAGLLLLIGKLGYIQLWQPDVFIVKPARVMSRNGLPVYSYNPRIDILTKELAAGTIYDRRKRILATSSPNQLLANAGALRQAGLEPTTLTQLARRHQRRYYPFDNQLFFWVGDANTRLFWNQENGYFAEATHLSQLRGFDTQPRKTSFITTRFKADRFSKPIMQQVTLVAYDYSPLSSLLRAGIDSREVTALKAKNRDVSLSVDAGLQVALQQAIGRSDAASKRTSVVVLDAASGDLLASAVYPLPNLQAPDELLLPEKDKMTLPYPVTDRDPGLTYPTAPGSTAKILTAAAAYNKLGSPAADETYTDITFDEIIRKGTRESEPFNEPIDMRKAIVRSSNVYFIRLANEKKLDDDMARLYLATGMNVDYVGGYSFVPSLTPQQQTRILTHWRDSSFNVNRQFYTKWRGTKRNRYNSEFSGLAWGQGQLTATPAAMARMAAAIANGGLLAPTRYAIKRSGNRIPLEKGTTLINQPADAARLTSFMIDQSNPAGGAPKISTSRVAGKTGTPERRFNGRNRFDGWYVFFAPTPDKRSHTVVCIRIELGESSGNAVKLADDYIVPVLQKFGYFGSF